jgi:hypothetical protein
MRVLHGAAARKEELQPSAERQLVFIAIRRDRHSAHQLHDEVGPAGFRGAGIDYTDDVGVINYRQGLPLRFEASNDLFGIHAGLDDLQRHLAAHGVPANRIFEQVTRPAFRASRPTATRQGITYAACCGTRFPLAPSKRIDAPNRFGSETSLCSEALGLS